MLSVEAADEIPDLRQVPRSTVIPRPGRAPLHFPNRDDYVSYLVEQGFATADSEIFADPHVVRAIQRDWHHRALFNILAVHDGGYTVDAP